MSYFGVIPPEIQSEILSYLSYSDLKNCAFVARSWSPQASRLLWHSLRFDVVIASHEEVAPASEKFARFISTLAAHPQHAPHIHRLALTIDGYLYDETSLSILENSTTSLTVPWDSIGNALHPILQLEYLELHGRLLFPEIVLFASQALSSAPVRALYTFSPIATLPQLCTTWSSHITDLLVGDISMTDCAELPLLPHLRFIASNNISVVLRLVPHSPIESICVFDISCEESEFSALGSLIRARATAGISTLRSVYFGQPDSEPALLNFIGSLNCPTLEHIHLVMDGTDWDLPFNMADFAAIWLKTGPVPSLSETLPALTSIRFEFHDEGLDTISSGPLSSEDQASSHLQSEAGLRLSTWLMQGDYPSMLRHVEVYSMGAAGHYSTYRTVNIEAKRRSSESGELVQGFNAWDITDLLEEVKLEPETSVHAVGLVHPLLRGNDRATLPVVPDADGVIRCD
ncbi:hypothetical protein DL93DRAFT_465483 [Clavulina sp. PMI_390]|nr:hypothetical protein DL93DRAFT_465483 [Clavulina sp. PMI_390]